MDASYDRMRAAQEHARADAATDMAAARAHRQLAQLFEERAGISATARPDLELVPSAADA